MHCVCWLYFFWMHYLQGGERPKTHTSTCHASSLNITCWADSPVTEWSHCRLSWHPATQDKLVWPSWPRQPSPLDTPSHSKDRAFCTNTSTFMYDITKMCVCTCAWRWAIMLGSPEFKQNYYTKWHNSMKKGWTHNAPEAWHFNGTLVKLSHSQRLKSSDTHTHAQPYKPKCCHTRIWLRSCSASCRNCSSSLIVPPCCVQVALRFKYWLSRGGRKHTRLHRHAHTPTRAHTHTRSTSWHLQDKDAEILWVHQANGVADHIKHRNTLAVRRMKKREGLRARGGVA